MSFPQETSDRVLSAWTVDSESSTYVAGLREAETVVDAVVNRRRALRDPPMQRWDADRAEDGENLEPYMDKLRAAVPGYDSIEQTVNDICASPPVSDNASVRRAPSVTRMQTNVNTIDIVKKNGRYSLVLDGVSQGEVVPNPGGTFDVQAHWMPRFKEDYSNDSSNGSSGRKSRLVQPVIVCLRLEDYETPPEACTVSVHQRVVNEGTVVMDNKLISTKEVAPYSTFSAMANVVVLPYPIITTPPPHVYINDFSKLMHTEVLAKFASDEAWYKSVTAAMQQAGSFVKGAFTQPLGTLGWASYAAYIFTLKTLKQAAVTGVKDVLQSAGTTLPAAAAGAAAQTAAQNLSGTIAGQTAAAALTTAFPSLAGTSLAMLGPAQFGLYAFGAWEMLRMSGRLAAWATTWEKEERTFFSDSEIDNIKNAHSVDSLEPPERFKITMASLARMIRRIAETRANGSLVQGTDQTVGMSVQSLQDRGWRAEAALLHWMMYGEGERTGADPVTGLYTPEECIRHSARFRNNPVASPLTGNTIDRSGLDPLSLSNTRTQFFFQISIKEKDGTPGPLFKIASTRLNGIDAGWISVGHDEALYECREAVDCLELKLTTLPGASRWMRGHSTLVADSNNGQIIGDEFDTTYNQMLGASADDEPKGNSRKRYQAALKQATAKSKTADKTLEEAQANLAKLRSDRSKTEEDMKKARKGAASERAVANKKTSEQWEKRQKEALESKRKLQANTDRQISENRRKRVGQNKPAVDVEKEKRLRANLDEAIDRVDSKTKSASGTLSESAAERLKKIDSSEKEKLRRMQANMRKTEQLVNDADAKATQAARAARGMKKRVEAAGAARVFANIFDYDATIRRIKENLLGDMYDEYQEIPETEELRDIRRRALFEDSYWRRVMSWPSTGNLETQRSVDNHVARCIDDTCASLGLEYGSMDEENAMVMRFMNTYAPVKEQRNPKYMRFASFVVPNPIVWSGYTYKQDLVVRTMPQVIAFSRDVVSTFGNLTIVQPAALVKSDFSEQPKAEESVEQSRSALRRVTNLFDVPNIMISDQGCHLMQAYSFGLAWGSHYGVLGKKVDLDVLPVDMLAASFLPSNECIKKIIISGESGGAELSRILSITSGSKDYSGVARLAKKLLLPQDMSSLIAMATFAEILAFNILGHGTRYEGGNGFDLQKVELVEGPINRSRSSAMAVASFVKDAYATNTSQVRRMVYNDAAFYCVPGMVHLRTALRRIDVLNKSAVSEDNWLASQIQYAKRFSESLAKLSRAKDLFLEEMPFSCVQSVLAKVPSAVIRMEGYENSIVAHVSSVALSLSRIVVVTKLLSGVISTKASVTARIDCVCSRPVVVKAYEINPSMVLATAHSAVQRSTNMTWQRPAARMSQATLKDRLARLRVNVPKALLQSAAIDPDSFYGARGADLAYEVLVDRMNKMSAVELARVNSKFESATYIVPFGLLRGGTSSDMAHMNFEMQPVWLEALQLASQWLMYPSEYVGSVKVHVALLGLQKGHATNPLAIQASASWVGIYLEEFKPASSLSGYSASDPFDSSGTDSVEGVCELFVRKKDTRLLSGDLSQHYRATMCNAERIMQACLMIASRAHIPEDETNLVASMRVPAEFYAPGVAVCACIANAIAYAETGSAAARVQLEQPVPECVETGKAISRMCQNAMRAGVTALSFSEMCMCLCSV